MKNNQPNRINLFDNRRDDQAEKLDSEEDLSILEKHAGKKINELFPDNTAISDKSNSDDSKNLTVFSLSKRGADTYINTNNCMGVVRFYSSDRTQSLLLQIKSRFDKNETQPFLTYLLTKVFGGNFMTDIPSDAESIWDILLAFMFRRKLQDARAIGLSRQYKVHEHNNLNYRGKFDLERHLKYNTPFLGKIAYKTRDISFDNQTNHLIRHAIKKINKKWPMILSNSNEIAIFCHLLEQNTPSWESERAIQCIQKKENRFPIKHPFFAKFYEPLRKISLSILRDEGAGLYDASSNDVEGILFDGAWLWEEYLYVVLKDIGFHHPENKKHKNPIYLFDNNKRYDQYPDFYKENMILDAKYKKLDKPGKIDNHDIQQIISYMHVEKASIGGFIYPTEDKATEIKSIGRLRGYGGEIKTIPFPIPETTLKFKDFISAMEQQENQLKKSLSEWGEKT